MKAYETELTFVGKNYQFFNKKKGGSIHDL